MNGAVPCVAEQLLAGLLAGRLTGTFGDNILQHVEGCPDCTAKLKALLQHDDLFGTLRQCERALNRSEHDEVEAVAQRLARSARVNEQPSDPDRIKTRPAANGDEATTHAPAIPSYRLGEEIGRGGMGVVYRAKRMSDDMEVAIKVTAPALAGSPLLVAKFLREAAILRKLDHPRIVRFLDLGEADGLLFFVMEYVAGTDMSKFLKDNGPVGVKTAVRTVLQLLSALEYAHGLGFVHRDIKPANLLLQRRSETKRGIKVADFGLARAYDASQLSGLTLSGDIGGTVDFMPPEQVANFRDVTPVADQFSAAATLYRLLTNQSLYDESKPGHPLMKVLQGEIIPLAQRMPSFPPALSAAVMRGLAREPSDRFEDVKAFREALLPFGR